MRKALANGLRQAITLLGPRRPGSLQGALQEVTGQGAGSDRRRLQAWTSGALRHRRTVGVVLGAVARRALKGRKPEAIGSLELFGYRLLFGGEPAGRLLADVAALGFSKKDRAHLERVLTAAEAVLAERVPLEDPATVVAAEDDALLPLSRREAVRFTRPVLGLTGRKLAARLGILYSLPDALAQSWIDALGEEAAAEACRAANDPAPLFARINRRASDAAAVTGALTAAGVEVARVEGMPDALLLGEGRGAFRHTDAWRAGAFSIQDLTAQRVAPLVAPQPGERLLDLCAAPGGKTTHLAELADDRAELLACDVKHSRLRRVEQAATRLGLASIRTRRLDGRYAAGDLADVGPFDGVLVDAPCSNTGVLRRRPEARWRYDARSQRRLTQQQAELLTAAAALVAPGGRLVYSLCSIEPDEGRERVGALLEERPDLTLEHEELWLPSPDGGDGGYAARVRRA